MHLTLESEFSICLGARNARLRLSQRSKYFLGIIPDGGHDAHSSHNDAPHALLVSCDLSRRPPRHSG